MSSSKKTDIGGNIIMQGSILAIAQIVTRLIGLVYRVPLQRIAGDVAMGYYGYAYDIYMTLLLISFSGIPLAVSKVISAVHAKKDYKNEEKLLRLALLGTATIGLLVGGVTFIFTKEITTLFYGAEMMGVVPALKVLAPTIFMCCFMGALRGYFQGIGNMVPTAVSQIFEQIFNAIVSVSAAYILVSRGAAYAAMGGTMGTCIGALASMIFLIILLVLYYPKVKKRAIEDVTHKEMPTKQAFFMMGAILVPIVLSSVIYQISGIIDSALYTNIQLAKGWSADLISSLYGIYTSKYKILINVPMALSAALGISVVPGIASAMIAGNREEIHAKIHTTVKFCMLIAIPSCVGLSVLGGPVMRLLFNDTSDLTVRLITIGTPYVLVYSLSTVTVGALQGIDKMKTPIINSAIALAIHTVFIVILLQFCDMNIYAILYSNVLFGFLMCVFNQMSLHHYIGYTQEFKYTFVIPAIASAIMGVITYVVYRAVYFALHINVIATLVAIAVAVIVYAILLILLKGITEEEIYQFPKGAKIVRIFKKFHLI